MPQNIRFRGIGIAIMVFAITAPAISGANGRDFAFIKANAAVMERMMERMAKPATGDADADFVNVMEPHHQGAIEMAELELRYGKNEQLRRLAQEIIISQQQEIVAMRLALNRPLSSVMRGPRQSAGTETLVGATQKGHHPDKDN